MSAEGASQLVTRFTDAGVLLVFAVLLGGAALLAGPIARRWGTSRILAMLALASLAAILAVTLGVRADGLEPGDVSLGWLGDSSLWGNAFDPGSAAWLLNVVLFIPAGLFVALATRRPLWTLIGLAGLTLLIETIQSLGLLGAPDPGDLVANTIGAAIGITLAAVLTRVLPASRLSSTVPHDGHPRRPASRRVILVGLTAAIGLATLGWIGLLAGADAEQARLEAQLRETYAGSTSADVEDTLARDDGFDELVSVAPARPSYLGRIGEADQFEGRWSTSFFGLHRCVFVRWTSQGIDLQTGSDAECTVFRERPPAE